VKKVIENIDSIVLEKVCSITIDDEKKKLLFDCKGNAIKITPRYTRAINMRYREKREKNGLQDKELSVVWILVGVKGEKKKILQVGRNCSLTRMLSSDIRKDVKEIIGDAPNSRYNNLCNGYNELIFYEIRISDFLENDGVFKEMFGGVPLEKIENSDLCSAYHTIRASYVEGKVAAIGMCKKMKKNDEQNMWCPSPGGIDGDIYTYWSKNT
jgi:hypothetical protein